VRRDTLLGLFWPELPQGRARSALRNMLHLLRREFGDASLEARGREELRIQPGLFDCDMTQVRAALNSGQLERALNLYRGPLLPGFFVPAGAPDVDEWLDGERRRLARAVAAAALELSRRAVHAGDHPTAVRWARHASDIAPDDLLVERWRNGIESSDSTVANTDADDAVGSGAKRAHQQAGIAGVASRAADLYLEGVYELQQRGVEPLRKGVSLLQRSIALDPRFALAHEALASACHALTFWFPGEADAWGRRAEVAAERALAIDDGLADAHAVLACRAAARGAWHDADARFHRAMRLAPDQPAAFHWYADFLQQAGLGATSVPYARHAVALDPASPVRNIVLAFSLLLAGEQDEAATRRTLAYRLGLERDGFLPLAFALDDPGVDGSIADLLSLDDSSMHGLPAHVADWLATDVRTVARRSPPSRVLADLESREAGVALPPQQLFLLALLARDHDRAMAHGSRLARAKSWFMAGFWLNSARELRHGEAFGALLHEIGLDAYRADTEAMAATG
jgi:tetratricopeptide (TPR) repeat protein